MLVGWERRERREEHDASLGEERPIPVYLICVVHRVVKIRGPLVEFLVAMGRNLIGTPW